ncbi:MAG TPA: GWxTD domain-containing protein, partial [Roseivirga sp.]
RIVLSFFLVLTYSASFAQTRMSSTELSFIYDQEHEFLIRYKTAAQGNQYKVYINFMLNSGNVKISDYQLSYDIRNSYIDEKPVANQVSIDTSHVVDLAFRQYTYELSFEKEENEKLLVLDVHNLARESHFILDIPLLEGEIAPPAFLLYDVNKNIPYFSSYINKNEPIKLISPFNEELTYNISATEVNEMTALPPFDETGSIQADKIPLDTVIQVSSNEIFNFGQEGFYTISSPKYSDRPIKILVVDEYFPYFGNYEDLIQPLIYISTNEEFKEMSQAVEKRERFEEFVNNTVSANERIAKDFIKYYYGRIRKSARLFTEDRPGWKTDRGMIYQVYGDPLQVFRNDKTELWVFPTNEGGRIRFIFDIVQEDGITKHKLIRGKRFRESWMQAVTQWRTGRIIE